MFNALVQYIRANRGLLLIGMLLVLVRGGESRAVPTDQPAPIGSEKTPPSTTSEDPLPIRRILVAPERLAEQLERARQGILIPLPRAEFEEKVQAAQRRQEAIRNPPRLLETRYRAALTDFSLQGSGEWRIRNWNESAGILAVSSWNLALRKARLQNERFEAADAVIGDLNGNSLGLLVDGPGIHTAYLDWTVRGTPQPGGFRFDLRLPPCTLATMELDLPANLVVVPRETFHVTGPRPAESPDRRLWQLDFAGESQIDLSLRLAETADTSPPLVLAHVHQHQEIEPDQVHADFDFELELPQRGVRTLLFDVDPTLQIHEVSVRNLESWKAEPSSDGTQPGILTVKLRELHHDATLVLQIRASASIGADRIWNCPAVTLRHAIIRNESIDLRLDPDLCFENWQSGSFIVANTEYPEPSTSAPTGRRNDNGKMLSLTRNPLPVGKVGLRPSARIRLNTALFQVQQVSWWQIGPNHLLTCQLAIDVVRGQLFRVPLELPADWEMEKVEMVPEGLRTWSVSQEAGKTILWCELAHSLMPQSANRTATAPARLTVTLRPTRSFDGRSASLKWQFPDVVPIGAQTREGTIGISIDASVEATLQTSALLSSRERKGPWGNQLPDYLFVHHGSPPRGSIQLRTRPVQIRAIAKSEVRLHPSRSLMVTRLQLQPRYGSPEIVDLVVTAPTVGDWVWKVEKGSNRVRKMQRQREIEAASYLRLLAGSTSVVASVLSFVPDFGTERWRIHFERPLTEAVALQATVSFPTLVNSSPTSMALSKKERSEPVDKSIATEALRTWQIPIICIKNATLMDGEVLISQPGIEILDSRSYGLHDWTSGSNMSRTTSQRTVRSGTTPAVLHYFGRVTGRVSDDGIADQPQVRDARLTTTLDLDGRALHHFEFQLSHWRQRNFPVRLPPGIGSIAVRVGRDWVTKVESAISADESTLIAVPVTDTNSSVPIELIYDCPLPSWQFWTSITAAAPELPVSVPSVRRVWRLPPSVIPVNQAYLRMPGPALDETNWFGRAQARARRPFAPFAVNSPLPMTAESLAGWHRRQETVEPRTLGDSLEQFLLDDRHARVRCVIDVQAFQAMGLTPQHELTVLVKKTNPESKRSRPMDDRLSDAWRTPWERAGIIALPCDSVLLLTTQEQMDAWSRLGKSLDEIATSLSPAVTEAVLSGHDSSGRFQWASRWLGNTKSSETAESRRSSIDLVAASPDFGFRGVDWEAVPEHANDISITLIREEFSPRLGAILAIAAILILAPLIQKRARGVAYIILILALALALAALWLPGPLQSLAAYPFIALTLGSVLILARWFWSIVRVGWQVQAAAVFALWMLVIQPGMAEAPAPVNVYVVPRSEGNQSNETVLAPRELLDQLQRLTSSDIHDVKRAVLLSADYQGQATETQVEFQAEYRVYSFNDASYSLEVAIGGVQLVDAFLDGADAHPTAVHNPREGYLIEVKGRGLHSLRLRFRVPLKINGDERQAQCKIPELIQSRLSLTVPNEPRFLYAVASRGAQNIATDANHTVRLQCDLGNQGNLNVRWRQEGANPRAALLQVHEYYLWRLQPAASQLTALLQFRVQQGAATVLTCQLPEQLDVRSIETTRLPDANADGSSPRLRDWKVTDQANGRRLILEFNRPVAIGVQVLLDLVPRTPLGLLSALPLPTPVGARTVQGFLAIRVEGVQFKIDRHLGVNGMDPATFAAAWKDAGGEDPGQNLHAYLFNRAQGSPPVLRLSFQLPRQFEQCTQNVHWEVEEGRAKVTAIAQFRAPVRDLCLIDWEIPAALAGVQISGAEVRDWSRFESRVQVWLQRHSGKEVQLQLTGWMPLERLSGPEAKKSPGSMRFRLQPVCVLNDETKQVPIEISMNRNLRLRFERSTNLPPLSDVGSEERVWRIATPKRFQASFRVEMIRPKPSINVLTFTECPERQFHFSSYLDVNIPDGELRDVTIQMLEGSADQLHFDLPAGWQRREILRDSMLRTWVFSAPDGIYGRHRIKISGILRASIGDQLLLPRLRILTPANVQEWIAVAGRDFHVDTPAGYSLVGDIAKVPPIWPAELERVRRAGKIWKVERGDDSLRIRFRAVSADAAPVRILLADRYASFVQGHGWKHQMTYWLKPGNQTQIRVAVPASLNELIADLDGHSVAVKRETDHLSIPLDGIATVRRIDFHWSIHATDESIEQPSLACPSIENATAGVRLWTVEVPRGMKRTATEVADFGADSSDLDLERARANLEICKLIAEQIQTTPSDALKRQLMNSQLQFSHLTRQIEYRRAVLGLSDEVRKSLVEQNTRAMESLGVSDVRLNSEPVATKSPIDDEGSSVTHGSWIDNWQFAGRLPNGTPYYSMDTTDRPEPKFEIIDVLDQEMTHRKSWSAVVVVSSFALGVMIYFRRYVAK